MEHISPHESNNQQLKNEKDLKKSKIISALGIGFLIGVVMFGLIAALYSGKYVVILPLLFPIYFIYKALKKSKK
jgi:hypothetical protein